MTGKVPWTSVSERRKGLVTATDIALYFLWTHHVQVKPATIWQWAARKHITSHGFRRERYDLREAVAYAEELGIIPRSPNTEQQASDIDL